MFEITFDKNIKMFHLKNDKISYVIQLTPEDILAHIYFGKKLNKISGLGIYPRFNRDFEVNPHELGLYDRTFSIGVLPVEYPSNGSGDFRESAIRIRDYQGSYVSDFRYKKHEIFDGVPSIKELPSSYVEEHGEAKTLQITLEDSYLKHHLILNYTIFREHSVISRSTRLINMSTQVSDIEVIRSLSLDLGVSDYKIVQLNGSWARERMIEEEDIHTGIKKIDSKRGTSSHHQTPFIAIADQYSNEDIGNVYGFQLIYSGSHEIVVEKDPYQQLRVQLGMQSTGFNWRLEAGDSFQSPEAIMTYTEGGFNAMSQEFHQFIKSHIIPRKFASYQRPVLINNWEATYFDFTESKIKKLVDSASEVGIELFVLDDGWFGKRNDDTSSLGDWVVDQSKLPNGLQSIADYVHSKKMLFGLWFEPEMISENSNLFREHPDWALQVPGRPLSRGRSQYVLDFSRHDVRENIYTQMCDIIDAVDIDYIKWDMNRHLSEVYSFDLPVEQAGEIYHRYVLGLYNFLEKITSRYPNILFESCSGGGGRFDLGMLQYMPQVWTSDNTDPVARLKIQYGTSMMAPLNTMGAHVSASPNHQTGRRTSLDFRAAVAFAGVFGYELDLTILTDTEIDKVKDQIEFYKKHRELIQEGIFTRLISPFKSNQCAWSIHNDETMIVFYYEVFNEASKVMYRLKLKNLQPDAQYQVKFEDETCIAYGDELMSMGIYINPPLNQDFQARVFMIRKVE